jgi:hypothetical protein
MGKHYDMPFRIFKFSTSEVSYTTLCTERTDRLWTDMNEQVIKKKFTGYDIEKYWYNIYGFFNNTITSSGY